MRGICANCEHHIDDHRKYSCEGLNGCSCSSSDYEEAIDQSLIDAAPDLLEACESLLGYVESDYESRKGDYGGATKDVLKARKAVAKAKGESL
jgi:uncharacterized protein YeeX (DUF496 family)